MKFEKRSGGEAEAPSPAPEDKPSGKKPVVIYIMILFLAAFLLMALSLLMHQRSNTEALGQLQNFVNAMQAVQGVDRKIMTFGEAETANVRPAHVTVERGYYAFDVMVDGKYYTHVRLSVPGRHNMMNALACCAASWFLHVPGEQVAAGLDQFKGSSRRFELTGKTPAGATVVDDYAHHPQEIEATLSAAAHYPHREIWCVFQPHTYSRTKSLMEEFAGALSAADHVVLADIYAAREEDIYHISSRDLLRELKLLGTECYYFPSFGEIEAFLQKKCMHGDLLITMGAGDIVKVGEKLLGM